MPTVDYYRRQLARRAYTEPAPRTGEVERWRRPEEPVVITVQTEPEYRDVVRYVARPAHSEEACDCLARINQSIALGRGMSQAFPDDPERGGMHARITAQYVQTREDVRKYGCHGWCKTGGMP